MVNLKLMEREFRSFGIEENSKGVPEVDKCYIYSSRDNQRIDLILTIKRLYLDKSEHLKQKLKDSMGSNTFTRRQKTSRNNFKKV